MQALHIIRLKLTNFLPFGRVFPKEGTSMLQEMLQGVFCGRTRATAQDRHCPGGQTLAQQLLRSLGPQYRQVKYLSLFQQHNQQVQGLNLLALPL